MSAERRGRRAARGTTLIEALAALALVGLAVLSSAGLLVRGRAIGRRLAETRVAAEAVASELALVRADGPAGWAVGTRPWHEEVVVTLADARGATTVASVPDLPGVRRVRVELTWGAEGRRVAREVLLEVRR